MKTIKNPAIEALIEADDLRRQEIMDNLTRERKQTDGDDKNLVDLALAFLTSSWRDPVFGDVVSIVNLPENTAAQIKIAALDHILSQAERHIVRLAKHYDPEALCLLGKYSIRFVEKLNGLAGNRRGRDGLRPFSQNVKIWPVLKSRNSNLIQNEDDYLDSLDVGGGLPQNFSRNAKWKPDTLADRLWNEINNARNKTTYYQFLSEEGKWLTDQALALPAFNERGAEKKWAILAFQLCNKRKKTDLDFLKELETTIPKSKKRRGEKSWLRRFLSEKFKNMTVKTSS